MSSSTADTHCHGPEEHYENDTGCVDKQISPELVQIKASEAEMNRRIESFIMKKRKEVDEMNIREFISPFSSDCDNSCARVDAVYIRREGQKSHITLKRVENTYGPQTLLPSDADDCATRMPLGVERAEAIEERLSNMERHLKLNVDNVYVDVISRLKALEERISFLEGLSPEYFHNGIPQSSISSKPKPGRTKHDGEDYEKEQKPLDQLDNLSDINARIRQLKHVLKLKTENKSTDHTNLS